jgi:hypothetical protein
VSLDLRPKGLAAAAGAALGTAGSALDPDPAQQQGLSSYGRRASPQAPSTSWSSASANTRNLPLATLCQVGDVCLVHDERALGFAPLDERAGCVRLTGADVLSGTDGRSLGRVRGYAFDPDSGALLALRYDALGAPRVPEAAMTVWEVGAGEVADVRRGALTLRPGAEGVAIRVADGVLGAALAALQSLWTGDGEEEDAYGGASSALDLEFEAWKEVHGRVFARYYGLPSIPATRAQLDAMMAAATAAQASAVGGSPPGAAAPPRRAVRSALPPARGRGVEEALQAAPPRRREREAVRRWDQGEEGGRPRAAPAAAAAARAWPPPPPSEAWGGGGGGGGGSGGREEAPEEARTRGREEAGEAPELAWDNGPGRRGGGGAAAPSPAAPSVLEFGAGQPGAAGPAPPPRQKEGIPLIDRSPPPPERVRDVDGRYGGGEEGARRGVGDGGPAAAARWAPGGEGAPEVGAEEAAAPPAEEEGKKVRVKEADGW